MLIESQYTYLHFVEISCLLFPGIDPENGPLRYSISGQYFNVDSATGVVTLAKSLDREEQPALEVIISITGKNITNVICNCTSQEFCQAQSNHFLYSC